MAEDNIFGKTHFGDNCVSQQNIVTMASESSWSNFSRSAWVTPFFFAPVQQPHAKPTLADLIDCAVPLSEGLVRQSPLLGRDFEIAAEDNGLRLQDELRILHQLVYHQHEGISLQFALVDCTRRRLPALDDGSPLCVWTQRFAVASAAVFAKHHLRQEKGS
jgi:hypothetical protein